MVDSSGARTGLPRHVLITQWQMGGFTGSEMVTLELVEHLASTGAKVTVVAHQFGSPVNELLLRAGDVELWTSTDPALDGHLRAHRPDLVWIQHQIIPEIVLTGELDVPVVFNHMSSYQPLEHPLVPEVERAISTVSIFNSDETLERQREQGFLDGFDPERLRVFANPAPDAMLEVGARENGEVPARLLLVSNHVPDELGRAVDQLPPGIEVVLVGVQRRKGAAPMRVDAALLADADAVVSIGKSVQYALAAGLPIYCYDRFGGPGWIDLDNLERARHHNFSGRGFERKAADLIARELVEGYPRARRGAGALREAYGDPLLLGAALADLWEFCLANPRQRARTSPASRAAQQEVTHLGRQWAILQARSARRETAAGQLATARRALTKSRADLAELRTRAESARAGSQREVDRLERRLARTERDLRRIEQFRGRRIIRFAARVQDVHDALRRRLAPGRL